MTGQLKAELDSILDPSLMESIHDSLDKVVEFVAQNSDEDVNPIDLVDYIADSMREYLKVQGGLNEGNLSTDIDLDDLIDVLEGKGSWAEINDYIRSCSRNPEEYQGWNESDFVEDFNNWILDKTDPAEEEVLMRERLQRNAGILK